MMATNDPEWAIPADLIDKLAETQRAEGWWCGVCDFDDPPCPGCVGSYTATAHAVLAALAEWAAEVGATYIDPATWVRVRAERRGTWHYAERNGEPWCDHPSSDGCSSPDLGERIPLYLLDPPLTREDP